MQYQKWILKEIIDRVMVMCQDRYNDGNRSASCSGILIMGEATRVWQQKLHGKYMSLLLGLPVILKLLKKINVVKNKMWK